MHYISPPTAGRYPGPAFHEFDTDFLLTIIPFLLASGHGINPEIFRQSTVWLNLLFLGLVASLACFLAWNLVMDRLGNVTSTNYVYLNPIFTLLSAMAFLGERLTLAGAIGSAAILLGVVWAGRKSNTLSPGEMSNN